MDAHVKDQLKQAQVPSHHVDKLSQLPEEVQSQINWPGLLRLIAEKGPGLVEDILSVFGKRS